MTQDQNSRTERPAPPGGDVQWYRNGKVWTVLALFVVVAGVSLAFFFDAQMFGDLVNQMQAWVDAAGPWGALVIILIMILHSFVFFPFELLAVVAGATYGFWYGSLIMWIGSMLAAAMCFQISRILGRPFLVKWMSPRRVETLDQWIKNRGAITLLVSRVLPILSFNLINYGAGLTNVSWFTFLWTTAVGIVPLIMLSVLFGVGLEHLPLWMLLALSTLAVSLILGVHHLAEKRGWLRMMDVLFRRRFPRFTRAASGSETR